MNDEQGPQEQPTGPDGAASGRQPAWLMFARLAAVVVVGVLIAVSVVLLRNQGTSSRAAGKQSTATNAAQSVKQDGPIGALEAKAPVKGQPAPNFALRDLDGNRVELSALRGKVVVVNFWATWCGPCKEEFPELEKVAREMKGDVVVLGLDQAEDAARVAQFRDQYQATFTLLLDSSNAVADAYKLRGIPDTIFVDRNGRVSDVVLGPLSAGTFRYKIQQALTAQ
jgi:cytochrome c biogenesis protein CcmG/thiol:disulfide interchange protein DsbE